MYFNIRQWSEKKQLDLMPFPELYTQILGEMVKFGLIIVQMQSCWRKIWDSIPLSHTLNIYLFFCVSIFITKPSTAKTYVRYFLQVRCMVLDDMA